MSRLKKLQRQLPPNTAYLLSSLGDIRYFTNFEFLVPTEREALLLITKNSALLLHASFSVAEVFSGITAFPGCYPEKLQTRVREIIEAEGIKTLNLDKDSLFVSEYESLLSLKNLEIKSMDRNLIWQMRMIKDRRELTAIKKASNISKKAFSAIRAQVAEGITEIELKELLEQEMKRLGSSMPAFPTIVAFGAHTALPHHQPTDQPLQDNTAILIDFGASFNGYCSDMTRSFWFGNDIPDKFTQLEQLVHQAYTAAMTTISRIYKDQTIRASEVDSAARSIIAAAGYATEFIHTTGHGLGLDIHENPSLSWNNAEMLQPGMAITVEPGIYLNGLYGYRHENTVALAKNEAVELTLD